MNQAVLSEKQELVFEKITGQLKESKAPAW